MIVVNAADMPVGLLVDLARIRGGNMALKSINKNQVGIEEVAMT